MLSKDRLQNNFAKTFELIIKIKKLSGRPQDIIDIKTIRDENVENALNSRHITDADIPEIPGRLTYPQQ